MKLDTVLQDRHVRRAVALLLLIQCVHGNANFEFGDFDGDGRADMLLRNEAGSFTCSTSLNEDGTTEFSTVEGLNFTLEWHLAALVDLDIDGKTDLLFRHRELGWIVVPMNGCSLKSEQRNTQFDEIASDSHIVGVLDLDGDQRDDLVTRNDSGAWSVIFLNDGNVVRTNHNPSGLPADSKFGVVGIGDFNGDRVGDILSRHVDGTWHLHTQTDDTGLEFAMRPVPFQSRSDWRDEATADFDGDGQHDLLIRHARGKWVVQTLKFEENASVDSWQPAHISSAWHWRTKATGDLNGDGRAELILFDRNRNQWGYASIARSDRHATEIFAGLDGVFELPRPPLSVPDRSLRRVLERKLNLAPGEWISERDVESVTSIRYSDSRAASLPKAISDLRGLRSLSSLTNLHLGGHQIKVLTPLIGLNLSELNLEWNQIEDVSALAGLADLISLSLRVNLINDVSSLETLDSLVTLNLGSNRISRLRTIGKLLHLEYLHLTSNEIVDIDQLGKLTKLKVLNLSSNPISNLSALESLTQLEVLNLSSRLIVDISPLATLRKLKTLSIRNSSVAHLAPLESLTELIVLNLDFNEIVDISPLSTLINLRRLSLSHNEISDLSALEYLTHLEHLNVSSNEIVDMSSLTELTMLKSLDLSSNAIADVSPLENLHQLETLDLSNNEINDIDVLLSLADLHSIDLKFNPLSETATNKVLPELRNRGIEVEFTPLLTYRDSRGRAATWVFDADAATRSANGLLIHFHGNVSATARGVAVSRFPWIKGLAKEHGLVSVIIASPESWSSQEGWRSPNSSGDSTRFWNYREDVDVVHEMLQTDFGGKLAVDKNRVYFFGTSQGTCFLHPFLNRWGQHYRGGLLADCGCVDVSLDPTWRAEPETERDFRVFVRAATGDFLHRASTMAFNYYKHLLGLETYGDLNADGGHCAEGDVSRPEALNWLVNGTGLERDPTEDAHFTRVSLADRIVALATDSLGALWLVRQERTGSNPVASFWRSVDRGDSFELIARHSYDVYDLDSVENELWLTTRKGSLRRSIDDGRTFDLALVNGSPMSGWIQDYRPSALGRPYEYRRHGLISARSGDLLLLPNVTAGEKSGASLWFSDNSGRSWQTEQLPVRSIRENALGPDPIVMHDANGYLQLSDPVKWISTNERLRWHEIDDPPGALYSVAWNGKELLGYNRHGGYRSWWSTSGPGDTWRERAWPDSVTERFIPWASDRLTAIDHGDVLMFGGGGEGHLYNGLEDSWTHIRGGTFLARRGVHQVAVDPARGDVFVSGGRGVYRLDARFRAGSHDIPRIIDRDSDGIPDNLDRFPQDSTEYLDTDRDGVGNAVDTDDDGDGVIDSEDELPLDRLEDLDLDLDGIGDRSDNDADGDGFSNGLDAFPYDANEIEDTDGDGIGNWEDLDDDNDGVSDVDDAFPRYALETADRDRDFIGDRIDPDPSESTLESQLHLTAAHGVWFNKGSTSAELSKNVIDGVTYPDPQDDIRYYGRLRLGDRASPGSALMMSIFPGEYNNLLYLDRNGDDDLTNDGGPIRLDNGRSVANWYEIWIEVSYQSGITLPYHISAYSFRAAIGSIESDDSMHLALPPSGRATRVTFPNGPSVSLAIVDANANAVFNDEQDYICVDIDNDRAFEGCGEDGEEHFPYGEKIEFGGNSYKVESTPSGYRVAIESDNDATSAVGRSTPPPSRDARALKRVHNESEITVETFYSPSHDHRTRRLGGR